MPRDGAIAEYGWRSITTYRASPAQQPPLSSRIWRQGRRPFGSTYAFASHFAPELLIPALQSYRTSFKPSEQLDWPYAMVGVNIIAAPTDSEARRLATTQQMSFASIFRGARELSQPPIDDIET